MDISFRRSVNLLFIRALVHSGDRLDGQGKVALLAAKEAENKSLAVLIGSLRDNEDDKPSHHYAELFDISELQRGRVRLLASSVSRLETLPGNEDS